MGTAISLPVLSRLFSGAVQRLVLKPLRPVLRGGLGLALCGVLWGCGWVNPAPPRSVVAEAVAQKVAQTQADLQRQLGLGADGEARAVPQASGIRITEHHWIALEPQPAVAVSGTYHLRGGGIGWGQQRQTRPFTLYLRPVEKDVWVVVDPAVATTMDAVGTPEAARRIPGR
ncbi:hypothetical protein GFS31_36080 [Leptolyngbya sp. BL0902]|uniref:hypothetical protein n=1 Tax=Leptolyngbya sp. BL0902 TaxID=1115757 RepID=UPI0018E8E5F2|nr:hypothetical protein [Leptolyngbya sp. BL0902]QQE66904.1 hypothetical protein GFS31_36080 [Leptolyngbya sp. BL0902]